MLTRDNLYNWQKKAISIACERSIVIAAQTGTGKSSVLLTTAADGIAAGKFKRILLIAPKIILDASLIQEITKWNHLGHLKFDRAHELTGAAREKLWFDGKGHIVTITPDVLPKFVAACIARKQIAIDAVFVDESQAFCAPDSARTKALLALERMVKHVILASGTPVRNGVIDSWAPASVVAARNPFWEKSFYAWRAKHFTKVSTFSWRPRPGAEKRIVREFEKNALSIRLEDTTDVPPAVYSTYPVDMGQANDALVQELMEKKKLTIAGEEFDCESDGAFLSKLHQLNQGFTYGADGQTVHVHSMARVEALKELLSGIDGPVFCAIKYKADVAMIKKVFPKAVVFDGSTSHQERQRIIAAFNADQIDLVLAHPVVAGKGLNLQMGSAKTVVWYGLTFSWEQYQQFNARLIRSGQKKIISVIALVNSFGLDQAILQTLNRKETGEKALMLALDVRKKRGN